MPRQSGGRPRSGTAAPWTVLGSTSSSRRSTPTIRRCGCSAKPLPVWAEPAPPEQWADVEAPLGTQDLSNPPPDVRRWHYWERCDPRGERDFERRLEEWDRQLREIHAGKRAHLDTWNQLTYDLAAMTRDDHGRLRLDCKLGTYFHSLSTSEALDPELMEAYAAWPDLAQGSEEGNGRARYWSPTTPNADAESAGDGQGGDGGGEGMA